MRAGFKSHQICQNWWKLTLMTNICEIEIASEWRKI